MTTRNIRAFAASMLLVLGLVPAIATGAPRAGSVGDPEDRPPNLNGVKYPDIRALSVSYEPETGAIDVTLDLYSGTYASQNHHSDPYIGLNLELGAVGADGRTCSAPSSSDTPRHGDLSVSLRDSSYNNDYGAALRLWWGLYGSVIGYTGAVSSESGVISADRKRLTWTFPGHWALVRRDYTCVTNIRMNTYPDWWTDEASPFFFAGFAPPPPAVTDTQRPRVGWLSPRDGDVISGVWQEAGVNGRHACRIDAADNVGVVRVDVALDGRFLNRELYAPWACVLDTTDIANGRHTLTATAFDAAGNRSSSTIEVVVSNDATTEPPPVVRPPIVVPTPLAPIQPVAAPVVPSPPAPTLANVDRTPPRLRVTAPSTSLVGFRKVGLAVPVSCDEACTARLTLSIAPDLARRLGIGPVLRRTTLAPTAGGRRALALMRPGPVVRGALASRRALKVRLHVVATDADGNRRVSVRTLRLRD